MYGTHWLVIAAGLGAIARVNWYFFLYFFLAERTTAIACAGTPDAGTTAAPGAGPVPQITVAVQGGYSRAVIWVEAGPPVRLVFDRQETSGYSEGVVFPDVGVTRFLPAFQHTTAEVTPPAPGRDALTCSMGMLRGRPVAAP